MTLTQRSGHSSRFEVVKPLIHIQLPSIAQLVERRTVAVYTDILRSLVQIRLEGEKLFRSSRRSLVTFMMKIVGYNLSF